jgi:DNA-binding IclR family transcriptional regulator
MKQLKRIQVIERMMSLLDVLADLPEPVSLKVLAKNSGLHPRPHTAFWRR